MAPSWHAFDPDQYVADNYTEIAAEDRRILERLANQHLSMCGQQRRTIEVGAGPNLYPVMAASVSSRHVTLLELSQNNVDYLLRQVDALSPHWMTYWHALVALDPRYAEIDFQTYLRTQVEVVADSVYEWQPGTEHRFDTVSSHFCVESITSDHAEFRHGLERLFALARPNAVLIAGFLRESNGYSVGSETFPAVALTRDHLATSLSSAGFASIQIEEIDNSGELANDHEWTGMLHALATKESEVDDTPANLVCLTDNHEPKLINRILT